VEKVFLFEGLLDFLVAHIFLLHVSDHLFALQLFLIGESEIISLFFLLAAKGLLPSFNSLTLTLGEIIFIIKVDFTTLALAVVAQNYRVKDFELLSTFISLDIGDKFLTHGLVS